MNNLSVAARMAFLMMFAYAAKGYAQDISIRRDSQAITILSQTIQAGGGADLLALITDLTESGTITYNLADPASGNVILKSRGLHEFKLEADLSIGKRIVKVNGNSGSLKDENGGCWPIRQQSAADLGILSRPWLPLVAALNDSSMKITYGGLVTHNGFSVYNVRLERIYAFQQDPLGLQSVQEERDIYIDPNTLMVVSIYDQLYSGNPAANPVFHEILYSNYQLDNGVAMPLGISETMNGATSMTIQLSQVTFNGGIADSEFE